jgi:hypothetical protein
VEFWQMETDLARLHRDSDTFAGASPLL